jgi:hypothetical protein
VSKREPAEEREYSTPPPVLECSQESIKQFTTWLAAEGTAGNLTSGQVRDLNQVARTMQAQIRLEHGLDEMEKYRALVARMEAILAEQKALRVLSRYSQEDAGPRGKWTGTE